MAKIGRNELCSCGSGQKFKRCCGTREAQAALARKADALEELRALGLLFPQLRPRGDAFAAWAERVAPPAPAAPPMDEGVALLGPAERGRIQRAHADEHPQVWRSLVDDVGDEAIARQAVVRGAVAAGVWERRALDLRAIAFVDDSPEEDPSEALALALDPGDLWSVYESAAADAALAELDDALDDDAYGVLCEATIAEQARRLATPWHEARLAALVDRLLRSLLPLEEHPRASTALTRACEAFGREADLRARLAALLLVASLGRLRLGPALPALGLTRAA